ncbi:phage baseplate assembly protein V [Pelagerythrobacter sp.]|uniref:phage baseplate assembly protein V n=1 Tax=Pelagerythrobacter sp. TaxID=2800702 RepID=UPI0035B32214
MKSEDIPADLAALVRIGTVTEVDLAAALCRVRYGDPDDEGGGAESPPVRWLAPRAGDTRVWSPPSVGEQVLLLAPDGQIGAAVALCGIVQDAFPPPGNDAVELIEFRDGARISYDPDAHALEALLPGNATAVIAAQGGITLRGDVTIEGELDVSGDTRIGGNADIAGDLEVAEDVITGPVSLREHGHSGVRSGTEVSGPPG